MQQPTVQNTTQHRMHPARNLVRQPTKQYHSAQYSHIPSNTFQYQTTPFPLLSRDVQQSIRDIRQLRIVLTSLMDSFTHIDLRENEAELVAIRLKEIQNTIVEIFASLSGCNSFKSLQRTQSKPSPLDLSVHLSLNLVNTIEHLEFLPDDNESEKPDVSTLRRIDWIQDRSEAARWLNRNREKSRIVLQSFLKNSFKRSSRPVDHDEPRKVIPDLKCTIIESDSRNYVLHVKVSNIMHCLITYRMRNAEHIIIRGLDESMCIKGHVIGQNSAEISWPNSSLNPDPSSDPEHDLVSNPALRGENILLFTDCLLASTSISRVISIQQLDLYTPSKHKVFQRITDLARCAILHFMSSLSPEYRNNHLLEWLAEYRSLYLQSCGRCKQMLGQNCTLPVYRFFDKPKFAQHEFCIPTSRNQFE